MPQHNKPAGFLPDQLVRGGLKTDFNAEFTDLFWDYYTFPGKDGAPGTESFGLHLHFNDEEGNADEQFYSAGKSTEWAPSEDKSQAIPNVEGKALNDSSNYAAFIKSILECGVPGSKLNTIKDLIGGNFFMTRVAQQQRQGLESDGKARTVLVAKRCNRMPWESKKSAGKKGSKTQAADPAAANSGESETRRAAMAAVAAMRAEAGDDSGEVGGFSADIVNAAHGILFGMLSQKQFSEGLAIKNIMPYVMTNKLIEGADRPTMLRALINKDVLAATPGTQFEGGVLSLG